MLLRQPVLYRRWQQVGSVSINGSESFAHAVIVITSRPVQVLKSDSLLGEVKRLYVMAAWKYRPRLASKWVREIAPTAERQVFWTQTNQMQTRYLDLRVPI